MDERPSERKVISLEARRPARGPSVAARLEAAWEAKRAGALLPHQADLDPKGLGTDLSHVFLLDRIAPGLARISVAGLHISCLMGTEAEGMPFAALLRPGARDLLRDAMTAVFTEPAVVRLSLYSPGGFARPRLTGEMLLLPLGGDRPEVTRVLGCLDAGPRLGRTPRRFEITGQHRRGLVGYARPVSPPARSGMAEAGAPYLRLVTDRG